MVGFRSVRDCRKNTIPYLQSLKEQITGKEEMFEKTSKYVIATVVFDDGTVLVEQAHTTDGIWRTDKKVLGGNSSCMDGLSRAI